MKYKEIIIKEDPNILNGHSDVEWAKLVGCTKMFINLLRRNKYVATREFYNRLLKVKETVDNV